MKNKDKNELVCSLLSDDELNAAMNAAGVRLDLLHGWKDAHQNEAAEFTRLSSLSKAQRTELERETIRVISDIRAEFRRRDLKPNAK